MVNVLGLPLDENSSFLRGAAAAPRLIVQAMHSNSSNLSTESGLDLAASAAWRDAGDLALGTGEAAMHQIETAVSAILERDERVLCLGGDHSVTNPIVRAHARRFGRVTVLHLDAHPDLYDDLDGNRWSHASPFARLCEAGLLVRLVQVGIRTANPHQRA